jgi:hypothetical protein
MTAFLAALVALLTSLVPGAAPDVAAPPVAAVVDYQLGGAYPPAEDVEVVVRDRSADPAPDTYSICYVNAFQTQPDELAWWEREHPDLLLRDDDDAPVIDPGWPDEALLDIGSADKRSRLADIVGGWFDECARDGFHAVEPDNLDAWTRSDGRTTRDDTVHLARLLADRAHGAGLAIAQKNAAELVGTPMGLDFAIAEECEVYDECGTYAEAYGPRVIEIEYTDNGRGAYADACEARAGSTSILLRDRDVVPASDPAYVFEHC